MTHEINIADKIKAAMPSFIDCLNAFVLTGAFVFLLAVGSVMAGASPPSAPTTAFVASQSSQQAVSTKGFNRFAGAR